MDHPDAAAGVNNFVPQVPKIMPDLGCQEAEAKQRLWTSLDLVAGGRSVPEGTT